MTNLLKPKAAAVGVKAAILSPASTPEAARVDRGMESLRTLGFLPVAAPHMLTRGPLYFAGTVEQRLLDLHAAFADNTIRVLFSTRGGYGSNYLLDELDMDVLGDHPNRSSATATSPPSRSPCSISSISPASTAP